MEASPQSGVAVRDAGISVVDVLLVEHRLLRQLLRALSGWLAQDISDGALRERSAVLAVALDAHAKLEEERLFASLRSRSETARHLIEKMEMEHDEILKLFAAAQQAPDPKNQLRSLLELAEAHFAQEELEVSPLAESD